jgi:hypothetical protein
MHPGRPNGDWNSTTSVISGSGLSGLRLFPGQARAHPRLSEFRAVTDWLSDSGRHADKPSRPLRRWRGRTVSGAADSVEASARWLLSPVRRDAPRLVRSYVRS